MFDDVKKLWDNGKTQKEIGEALGITRHKAMEICNYLGFKRDHKQAQKSKLNPKLVEEVIKYRNQGKTIHEIVSLTGSSVPAVGRISLKYANKISPIEKLDPSINKDEICLKYNNGYTFRKLETEYGISYNIIRGILKENNIKIRPSIAGGSSKIKIENVDLPEYVDSKEWFEQAYTKYGSPSIAKFISKALNRDISSGFVDFRLTKYGVKKISISDRLQLNHNDVIDLYNKLGSPHKVAKRLNSTIATVRSHLERDNIKIKTTSEILSGEGNSFYGQKHSDEIVKYCTDIGSLYGKKFWDDNPSYVQVVREKQKEIWSDIQKRSEQSKRISELRRDGKCNSYSGEIQTRFGTIKYDSSYEHKLIEVLDRNNGVKFVERDFCLIEYEHDGSIKNFIPDFRVWLTNGDFIIVEVKSKWLQTKDSELYKINAAFGVLADKFIVLNDDMTLLEDMIKLSLAPAEFDFNQVELKLVNNIDYTNFYSAFHYLGRSGRSGETLGAYLNNRLIAAATISSLTRIEIAKRLNKSFDEIRELVRFCIHHNFNKKNFGSWFLSKVVSSYRKNNPSITTLISFSDTTQGHYGVVYKAAGWRHDGETNLSYHYIDKSGQYFHKKTIWDQARKNDLTENKYAMGLGLIKVAEKPKKRFILEL